jgi:hypothetical protein
MALEKMGMVVEFINIVKVLFQDMEATICINGGITSSFKVERGVRQGYLAPYLFILAREVLNFMMKEVTSRGDQGDPVMGATRQHTLSQNVDDTTISMKGEEGNL